MCTPEARPCMCTAARPCRAVQSWVRALPLLVGAPVLRCCHKLSPSWTRASRQCTFCAQHSAAALLCLLLAAVGAPTRAELSQSEFNRIMTKFRAQAQGASAVSNHCPRFLCAVRDAPRSQEDVLRAITQVQNILNWDSPESVSKLDGDSLKGKRYDVILYHEPPFVVWEDRGGTADPVSMHVGDLNESDGML